MRTLDSKSVVRTQEQEQEDESEQHVPARAKLVLLRDCSEEEIGRRHSIGSLSTPSPFLRGITEERKSEEGEEDNFGDAASRAKRGGRNSQRGQETRRISDVYLSVGNSMASTDRGNPII